MQKEILTGKISSFPGLQQKIPVCFRKQTGILNQKGEWLYGFAHQIDCADVNIIVKDDKVCIGTHGDLTLDAGIAAVAGRSLGSHADSGPQGDTGLLVDGANQTVTGSNAAGEAVSCRGLADTVLDVNLASYSPSGKPPRGPQSDTIISLS